MYERPLPLGRYGDHTAGICGAGLRYRFLRASRLVFDLFYAVRSCRDFHVCRLQRPTDSHATTVPSIMQNDAQAQEKMQAYLADYLNFRCRPAMHIRLCCAACSVPSWMAAQ